ncbi:AhpC/TSA family protein [Natronincola ferrireducens]|nr:AhpC/TSA family protein [Natronincola ferrireducens]
MVLGISKDSVKSHAKFRDKQNLPYPLLSDEEKNVLKLYGVLKPKKMFGKEVFGTERSTFIINRGGILVKEYRGVKVKGHVDEILAYIKDNVE